MEDEGLGVHAANHLQKHYHFKPEIEIVDGGTSVLDLLTFFGPEKSILIIDAVNFEMEPGTVVSLKTMPYLLNLIQKFLSIIWGFQI